MRTKGLEQTPFSALSRAVAGSRKRTLIINLPGSPRGAVSSLQSIQHLVSHVVDLLEGRTNHSSDAKLE
jgi:molybdopterin biosynthesis enzyme MoaB